MNVQFYFKLNITVYFIMSIKFDVVTVNCLLCSFLNITTLKSNGCNTTNTLANKHKHGGDAFDTFLSTVPLPLLLQAFIILVNPLYKLPAHQFCLPWEMSTPPTHTHTHTTRHLSLSHSLCVCVLVNECAPYPGCTASWWSEVAVSAGPGSSRLGGNTFCETSWGNKPCIVFSYNWLCCNSVSLLNGSGSFHFKVVAFLFMQINYSLLCGNLNKLM